MLTVIFGLHNFLTKNHYLIFTDCITDHKWPKSKKLCLSLVNIKFMLVLCTSQNVEVVVVASVEASLLFNKWPCWQSSDELWLYWLVNGHKYATYIKNLHKLLLSVRYSSQLWYVSKDVMFGYPSKMISQFRFQHSMLESKCW